MSETISKSINEVWTNERQGFVDCHFQRISGSTGERPEEPYSRIVEEFGVFVEKEWIIQEQKDMKTEMK